MKPKFTNKTTMDGGSCREFLALAWPKNSGLMRWLLLAVALFAVGYGVLQLVLFGGQIVPYAVLVIAMGGVAFFMAFWGYFLRLPLYKKKQQQAWGGPSLSKTVLFFESDFLQHSRLGELTFRYAEIDSLRQGRRSLLIGMGSGALLLDIDGFADNSYPAFLAFLLQKCPQNIKKNRRVKKAQPQPR